MQRKPRGAPLTSGGLPSVSLAIRGQQTDRQLYLFTRSKEQRMIRQIIRKLP